MDNNIVIGLTGSFGSGCTYIGKTLFSTHGYQYISLSSFLKSDYKKINKTKQPKRCELQDHGNQLRKNYGNDYLARLAHEHIKKNGTNGTKWIVDSIRNPHEAEYLRSSIPNFFLVGVYADLDIRFSRKKGDYPDKNIFMNDDKRDADEKIPNGQRVQICFKMSDIIILNNNHIMKGNQAEKELAAAVEKYVKLIEKKEQYFPTEDETLMSIAYATSMRSTCLKRKVGAIIIDKSGTIHSSGYNEVPYSEETCQHRFGGCYRDIKKKEILEKIKPIVRKDKEKDIESTIGQIKYLDHCRALHAEENAIINIVKLGTQQNLSSSTLYTTTYPCTLCANKIASIGIMKVVYLEPYPMEEAQEVLTKKKVVQAPFSGVLYNGYFKLFGRINHDIM